MTFLIGAIFGVAGTSFLAAGVFLAYYLRLRQWITTDSEDVKIIENAEGQFALVRLSWINEKEILP